ncbi:pyridoxine 5'-phosphate synthase [Sulfurimonas marina]|uniref:Pyridoxine 5'-phosphate synthase n=1 Tax=Sulfurimonas marina TaxID=2590551 RepID=A0A7M1AUI1_9BACT|nr:pyridoxine 5'-phosphate synthase [Sulfurimonas marina]QOP41091.1 pyridoxine 5'-phosphate synthase [Sulfurimonas marina]
MKLGVNIDHVAVLREAREINDPDILQALYVACQNGADQITIHLREDRRHIQDVDVTNIISFSKVPVNLECAIEPSIIDIVCQNRPHRATLVPEKRQEVTTEGGLDLFSNSDAIKSAIEKLHAAEIPVSLFVDPTIEAMKKSKELGAEMVELHTGHFANLFAMLNSSLPYSNHSVKELELSRAELTQQLQVAIDELKDAAIAAVELGLEVAAGHGLNYHNVHEMVAIKEITELNIGQSIIARSVFSGLDNAVKEMKRLTQR